MGIPPDKSYLINNTLLGSVSEFACFVICSQEYDLAFPFIGCFRASDPFGRANFPLVDVRMFFAMSDPAEDRLSLQEIKTTRDNASYFKETLHDYDALYPKSRLFSSAEHLKADLAHAGKEHLIPRLNDCLATCEEESTKIELLPTGISGDSIDEEDCIATLDTIVSSLKSKGWPEVEAMYLRVPDIEATYLSLAIGEGDV